MYGVTLLQANYPIRGINIGSSKSSKRFTVEIGYLGTQKKHFIDIMIELLI